MTSPDGAYRVRDMALRDTWSALRERCASRWDDDAVCRSDLCELRARELHLLSEVRAHRFDELSEWNYWHRGRLKFPGEMEQVLQRLGEEPQPVQRPCGWN